MKNIQLFVTDVDGVLTDGRIYLTNNGDEIKAFNVRDGMGIKLLQTQSIPVAIITARTSQLLERRAKELGIKHIFQGREDKQTALQELCEELNFHPDNVAYIGDDLPDIGAIQAAGVGMSVADASEYVKQHASWISTKNGGDGAIREAAEAILSAKGLLEAALGPYANT